MWAVNEQNITMAEGDYGIALDVKISGVEFTPADTIRFTIKKTRNGNAVLEKDFVPSDNKVSLSLTLAESALFPVGQYVYSLDWYQAGSFLCNIIPIANFKVVDKA